MVVAKKRSARRVNQSQVMRDYLAAQPQATLNDEQLGGLEQARRALEELR